MRFGNLDSRSVVVARAFFHATTKLSDDDEDILPQEDSLDVKLSVYGLFSELFPEHVVSKECGAITGKNGLTRLQFNKIGYEMYVKEQSRRVPAPRAKPGNPGYGFRRAKWRNVSDGAEDQGTLQETLQSIGIPRARCDYVRLRVDQIRMAWEHARRPSRPAGPGRPRGRARGDKTDAFTPEPAGTLADSLAALYPGLSTVSSALGTDAAALKYAKQIEQVALLRTAFERAQQPGLTSPQTTTSMPQGLLAPQAPLSAFQHLLPPGSAGLSGMMLHAGAGSGGQQLGRQHLSLAALNVCGLRQAGPASPFSTGSQPPLEHLLGANSSCRLSAGETGVSEMGKLSEGQQLRTVGVGGAMQHLAELAAGMGMAGSGAVLGGHMDRTQGDGSGGMEACSFASALRRQQQLQGPRPQHVQGQLLESKALPDGPLSGKRKQEEKDGENAQADDEDVSADEEENGVGRCAADKGCGARALSGKGGKARKLCRLGSLPCLRDDEEDEPRGKRREDEGAHRHTIFMSGEGLSSLSSSLSSSSPGRQAVRAAPSCAPVRSEDPALTHRVIQSGPRDTHRQLALAPQQTTPGWHMPLPSVESWLPRTEKLHKLHILGEMSLVAAQNESGCASSAGGGGGRSASAGPSSASTSAAASPPAPMLGSAGGMVGEDSASGVGACKNKAALTNLLTG